MFEALIQATDKPVLLFLGIVIATFILEDGATIAAALLAVDQRIAPLAALIALYSGILLGDLGLYGIGRFASISRRLRYFIGPRRLRSGRNWFNQRLFLSLFGARFTPGMRGPTFMTMGFLGVHFWRFALIAILAVSVWSTLVFTVVYALGEAMAQTLGAWTWAVGLFFILVLAVRGWMTAKSPSQETNKAA